MSSDATPAVAGTPQTDAHTSLAPIRAHTILAALIVGGLGIYIIARTGQLGSGGIDLPWLALFALAALQPLLSRWLKIRPADTIVIFAFTSIAFNILVWLYGHTQSLIAPPYFALPDNRLGDLFDRYVPAWFAPRDAETIRIYWEGDPVTGGSLLPWLKPMGLWIGFYLTFWATMYCITALLRRYWNDHEHLGFPQAMVPLYVANAGTGRFRPAKSLWTEPLMWVGFGITFIHFMSIIWHGLSPSVPTLGNKTDLGVHLTERPFDALRPVWFCYNPMLTGFAYFAPQDLNFSMWFFYLFYVGGIKVFYAVSGLPQGGAPWTHEQTAGAFFAVAALQAWAGRGYLRRVWRAAVEGGRLARPGDPHPWADPLSPRAALIGLGVGFAALCGWYIVAGMSWWVAAAFLFMAILFATVYTRGRAETGAYPIYLMPYFQASRQLKSWLGSDVLAPRGNLANLTLLAGALPITYGFFCENMTFQPEALKMGEECRIKTSHITALIIGAALVGLVLKFYTELSMNNEYGALASDPEGGWWPGVVRNEYNEVGRIMDGTPLQPDWSRNGYTVGALLWTLLLAALRMRFPRSPLNPIGFALSVHYGVIHWGPFLVAWASKSLILRLGGGRLYHRLTPLFIGLILGQVFTHGIVWNLFAAFTPEQWKALAVPLQG